MLAFVLCAGKGTRLAPLTDILPKPALPLLGVPLVRYTFAHLKAQGVTRLVINTHHLAPEMERVARESAERLKLPIECSHEPVLAGTGGGLRDARRFLPADEPFIVWNGDILGEVDIAAAVAAHKQSGAIATMVLRPMPHGETYAAVEVDASGAVQRIAGRGADAAGELKGWHFSGIHVIEPRLLEHIAPAGEVCVNREVYLPAIARGEHVHGHVVQEGYWSDLGTPERYLSTQGEVMMGALDFEKFPTVAPLSPASRTGIWSQPGAKYARAVVTVGPTWLGPKSVLETGARAGPNAAVNGTVHQGAEVYDAALLDGEVAPGERLYRAIRLGGKTAVCK